MQSATALQAKIFDILTSFAPLVSSLGGSFVYDDVPDGQKPPYVVFGSSKHSDWSTSTEDGVEHSISLDIWSSENGRKQVLEISQHIVDALTNISTTIQGHNLINLTSEKLEITHDAKSRFFHGVLSFRAVTEPSV